MSSRCANPRSPSSPPSASRRGPSPSRARISSGRGRSRRSGSSTSACRTSRTTLTEGLTQDSFNLLTSVYVGWKVSDPAAFFPRFAGSADPIAAAEALLDQWLGNAKTAVVGKHPLSDFVSTTDNGANFVAIEKEILAAVQSQLRTNNYGLEIEFLGIKRLQLPESVSQRCSTA